MKDTRNTDAAQGAPPFPPISLSEDDWLDFFDEVDATDTEKRDMIRTLWSMMLTFVDIAWTHRSLPETSGQIPDLEGELRRAVVHSDTEQEDV